MAQSFVVDGYTFSFSSSGAVNLDGPGVQARLGYPPLTARSFTSLLTSPSVENTPGAADALNLLASQVDSINQLIANAQRPITNEAPASSGDIVSSQQTAKDDGALDQDPILPATVLTLDGRIVPAGTPIVPPAALDTTVVNGQTISATQEAGTDAPLKTITQTQATPPYDPNQNAASGTLGSGTFIDNGTLGILSQNGSQAGPNSTTGQAFPAGQLPGVGSGTGIENLARQSEDNPNATNGTNGTNTRQVLTQTFSGLIRTQQNQLDQYASYTYALSWFLLTPAQYNAFQTSQKKDVANWQLLMQSGGAAATPTVYYENDGQTSAATGGRSQFFPLDYYMDDLEIYSTFPLGGTGMCHSAMTLKFKVSEPNGITLVDKLYKAVKSVYKQVQPTSTVDPQTNVNATVSITNPNYPTAQYCLIIHFYGYDTQGNLVVPATGTYSPNGVPSTTDPKAVIEKYYPFLISNLKYRMAKSQIEYEIEGRPIGQNYALGTDRGSIPFNFNLSGQTIGQLLVGQPVASGTNTADPGARISQPTPSNNTAVSPATASVINSVVAAFNSGGSSSADLSAGEESGT